MPEKKRKEIEQKAAEWMQKAEMAVDKEKDDLAKAALEHSMTHRKMAESFKEQESDQKAQAELLKASLKTPGAMQMLLHHPIRALIASLLPWALLRRAFSTR